MNRTTRDRIKRNLFPAAHPSVEPWNEFRWHTDRYGECDTDKVNSSQALAIDVFGTLSQIKSRHRIFDEILSTFGFRSSGRWNIDLEWPVPNALLGEPRETQVDAVARSKDFLVFMECKFSESEAGRCSQPSPLAKGTYRGIRQCNGNYESQVNQANGKAARCSLTGKGIKYWEYIPEVFSISPIEVHRPCPFADFKYQWMRNLVACWAQSRAYGIQPIFLVVYADALGSRQLPTARFVRSNSWASFKSWIRPSTVFVGEISYLRLLETAVGVSGKDETTLRELRDWVEAKIQRVATTS